MTDQFDNVISDKYISIIKNIINRYLSNIQDSNTSYVNNILRISTFEHGYTIMFSHFEDKYELAHVTHHISKDEIYKEIKRNRDEKINIITKNE